MTTTSYRPDIDGLRAVAVIPVVLHHLSAPLVPGGYVGVDVFFVISGYLITRIISREMEAGTFTFTRFYERRARRIFPALFSVLAVTLFVGYFLLLPSDYVSTLRGVLGTLFFASNIVFWRELAEGYFAATDAGLNPLLHTWSLAVEEQFYLLFPVFLLICLRFSRRHLVTILMVCGLVSLAAAAMLVQTKSVAVFFLSPFRAWELLAGSLLALNAVPTIRGRAIREAVAAAGLVAIVAACFLYDDETTFPGLSALVPVLGATAIIHAGESGSSMVGRLLQLRPVIYVGLISYSLYLWHWPLIVLVRYAMGAAPITTYAPAVLAASLMLGALSYHFIEQPVRRKSFINQRSIFSVSTALTSVLAVVCLFGLVKEGFTERFSREVVQLDRARYPNIPFRNCEGRSIDALCSLGQSEEPASVLLWGDSHLLAWAPALDKALSSSSTKAVLVTSSACPPMLRITNKRKEICTEQNHAVKMHLQAHPEIKLVVMSARWGYYFRVDGPFSLQVDNRLIKGQNAASAALATTIQWLRDQNIQVILIGPVPTYEYNVPFMLAQEKASGQTHLYSTSDKERRKHTAFIDVVNAAQQSGTTAPFYFIDPIQWLCPWKCIVEKDGVALYRDNDHLSVEGAMAVEKDLSLIIGTYLQNIKEPTTRSVL